MFRVNANDAHPTPWIRVKLSAALGRLFYPQKAWDRLTELWESYYPLARAGAEQQRILALLDRTLPDLARKLVNHRPASLRGQTLLEALDTGERQPSRLRELFRRWRTVPQLMYRSRPIVVFAAIGQARADNTITPEEESAVLAKLLSHWGSMEHLAGWQ